MRSPRMKDPVANFALPIEQPAELAEPVELFDRVATDWARGKGQLRELNDAIEAAEKAVTRARADAILAGDDPDTAPAVKAAQKALDDLQAASELLAKRVRAADIATDEAGNALAVAVGNVKAAWLARLEQLAAEREQRLRELLALTRAAADDLGYAVGGTQWLESFEVGSAVVGDMVRYHGKPAAIPWRRESGQPQPERVDLLLDAVQQALDRMHEPLKRSREASSEQEASFETTGRRVRAIR